MSLGGFINILVCIDKKSVMAIGLEFPMKQPKNSLIGLLVLEIMIISYLVAFYGNSLGSLFLQQ